MAEPETISAPTDTENPDGLPASQVTASGGIITRQDGGTAPIAPTDWRASLPIELQAEPTLAKYTSLEDALKGAVHAQRQIGKGVEYPKPDAKPDQVAEFRKRAGVPASADQYGVTLPKAPDGQEWDPGQVTAFLGKMHAAHARPEVVQAALDHFVEYMAKQSDLGKSADAQERLTERAEAIKKLERVWGPQDGPLWKHHEARALALIDVLAEDNAALAQRWRDMTNDPEIAQALSDAAPKFIEAGFQGVAEQHGTLSIGSAQAEVNQIRDAWLKEGDRHPLSDERHPEHAQAMRRYEALLKRAAGPRGHEIVAEVRR